MNISSLASTLSQVKQQQVGTEIGVKVLKNVMDIAEQSSESMISMMENMSVPIDPNIGSHIDTYI